MSFTVVYSTITGLGIYFFSVNFLNNKKNLTLGTWGSTNIKSRTLPPKYNSCDFLHNCRFCDNLAFCYPQGKNVVWIPNERGEIFACCSTTMIAVHNFTQELFSTSISVSLS